MNLYNSFTSRHTHRSLLSSDCDDIDAPYPEDLDLAQQFEDIYYAMAFLAILWFTGKLFARCGLPSLVGEIACGIIFGPNLLNLVPYNDALQVIGEIGLVLLVLEAGIDVSIGHLKVVGFRGLFIAIVGSMLPLAIGTVCAYFYQSADERDLITAFAIGACFAPTSMGIALNVLRNGKVLNTPTGQLIIAAAVLDDVIALMLLSELEALADPTLFKIIFPLIISPIFILFFGFLAIKPIPWLTKKIMTHHRVKKSYHENIILLLLFIATFALIPLCFYAGSSHLLGAFLAGLMFCTDHTIHVAWNNQMKRIMLWMLRIFFACTIGFEIPVQDFWTSHVYIGALLLFTSIAGKYVTGIFSTPLTMFEFFTVGFSMGNWGAFVFILATSSYAAGRMDKDSFSSVTMAALMSITISPLLLRITLRLKRKAKEKLLTDTRAQAIAIHSVYFRIHGNGRGQWGHQNKFLHSIFDLDLEIVDFRSFAAAEFNYSHHLPLVQDICYVRDKTLSLPPTKRLSLLDEDKLNQRYKKIKLTLKKMYGIGVAHINVMRWLPGVRSKDDCTPKKAKKGKAKSRAVPTPIYCRKEAYKQARMALNVRMTDLELERDNAGFSDLSGSVTGISRIRPAHDKMYRNKFSYTNDIHCTDQGDELIAMAFIDTLQSIERSLSPEPSNHSNERIQNMNEELLDKINTLSGYVQQLQVFKPALSDDGSVRSMPINNAESPLPDDEDEDDGLIPTMYGDEDENQQPLAGYAHLDDLHEDSLEYIVEENDGEMDAMVPKPRKLSDI